MAKNIPSNESKGLQPRLLYPARLSIKIGGEIRSFPEKEGWKNTPPPNQHCNILYRDCSKKRTEKSEREEHKYKGEKMNKYLSIIAFNVNGLNAPIKRHREAEWIRKHDPHVC